MTSFSLKNPFFWICYLTLVGLFIVSAQMPMLELRFAHCVHWSFFTSLVIISLFGFIPWYGFNFKGLGIDDHYEKILLLVTAISLPILAIEYFSGFSLSGLKLVITLVFIAFIGINLLLLKYHLSDKDQTPPAYFAADLFLKDQAKGQS